MEHFTMNTFALVKNGKVAQVTFSAEAPKGTDARPYRVVPVKYDPATQLAVAEPLDVQEDEVVQRFTVIEKADLSMPVPVSVSNAQFRDAITLAGIFPDEVLQVLNAISDPTLRQCALNRWEYASVIERGHPLIAALAPSFGLSEKAVDELFIQASKL